jgi:hypothetical protein
MTRDTPTRPLGSLLLAARRRRLWLSRATLALYFIEASTTLMIEAAVSIEDIQDLLLLEDSFIGHMYCPYDTRSFPLHCITTRYHVSLNANHNHTVQIHGLCIVLALLRDPAASPPCHSLSGPLSLGFIATLHSNTTEPQNKTCFTTDQELSARTKNPFSRATGVTTPRLSSHLEIRH